jgi:hypothetical protein
MKMSNSLQGRWICILDGEYGIAGQITMADGPNHYLVRMVQPYNGPPVSRLMSRDDLCTDVSQEHYVSIFDSEAELKAWLAWVDNDNRPKVVKMQKDRKPPVW